MSSTVLINIPGTYDLNGDYGNYNSYFCDCTSGNIVLSMQQALFTGIYYNICRIDNSSNTLTINSYSGDNMNGSYTTLTLPPYSDTYCQTYADNQWVIPIQTYSTH